MTLDEQTIQQRFAERCKRMLEDMAKRAACKCGGEGLNEFSHEVDCPVGITLRNARAVWMLAQQEGSDSKGGARAAGQGSRD